MAKVRLGLSRTTRIILLLVIDVCLFLIELVAGYTVGSLALVADSFHMLNDVVSLVIALYAIKISTASATSHYSYGWHRAEILAALVNGVFLLALCFSIFMEAIEKFINTPEVSNPLVVVIVGCFGLLSNLVGLVLFHGITVLVISIAPAQFRSDHTHHHHTKESIPQTTPVFGTQTEGSPLLSHPPNGASQSSSSSLYGHPIQNRQSVVEAAQDMQRQTENDTSTGLNEHSEDSQGPESLSLQKGKVLIDVQNANQDNYESNLESRVHSHGSGSMNMRALVLHVLGDALGNAGVIATGLIIWLSRWQYRYYCDPIISLIITLIIFSSAMPLVKSASFILLQGVPSSVSLERVRLAIRRVPGVLSIHELHVWQLSESKLIASVHVCISSKVDYMAVQSRIRRVLHDQGMHSSTIQPEVYHTESAMSEDDLVTSVDTRCLLACPPDQECCSIENACCPPGQTPRQFLSRPSSPPLED